MKILKVLKNIWAQLHRFVFWAIILSILWCWIYTFVDDAPREKKVLFYIDAYGLEERALTLRLEEECLPEGIKMIRVRSFDYDIFGSSLNGDLYLMKESILKATLDESPEKLAAIELPAGRQGYEWNGKTWGILAFDPAAQKGPAMDYIQYALPGASEPEPYYLCFEANAYHLASQSGALDNAAWEVGMALLNVE